MSSMPECLITHRVPLDRVEQAFEAFEHAAETHALKVVVELANV